MFRQYSPWVLLAATLLGCGTEWQESDGGPIHHADSFVDGDYFGPIYVEARAYVGPIMVKRGECSTFVRVAMRGSGLAGSVQCDFGPLGLSRVELVGEVSDDATATGAAATDLFDARWDGWFHGEDKLYAEMSGSAPLQNVRIEYYGWFDVALQPVVIQEELRDTPSDGRVSP